MVSPVPRYLTIFCAFGTTVLSGLGLGFLTLSLVKYRASDFFIASTTSDFARFEQNWGSTCVETLTQKQLKSNDFDHANINCRAYKERLTNALAVSVHGIYYAIKNQTAGLQNDSAVQLDKVMAAMVGHVLGKQQIFYGADRPLEMMGINYTTAYKALNAVASSKIPVSCDTIYNRTYDQILEDWNLVVFIENIRIGREWENKKVKSSWPLVDFVVDCNDKPNTDGNNIAPFPNVAENDPLTDLQLGYMHAHCTAQFQYASVGSLIGDENGKGTFGIPLPGTDPGPQYVPYAQADGFSSNSSYTTKARMFIGQRFGLSIWGYVPMFLVSCYFLGDSLVFFMVESFSSEMHKEQVDYINDDEKFALHSLVIRATSKASRLKRTVLGFFGLIVSIVCYAVFIASPWSVGLYSKMPRPICEATMQGYGADPNHDAPASDAWLGTTGGWKADYDATWYDLAALITQIVTMFLLPTTTLPILDSANNLIVKCFRGKVEAAETGNKPEREGSAPTSKSYVWLQKWMVPVVFIGSLIAIVGQSVVSANFGMAWADGVMEQGKNNSDVPIFDEKELAKQVYDQIIGTLAITVSCGFVFSLVLQRYLIQGIGCFSAGLFFGWVFLVGIMVLPLIVTYGIGSIFSESSANEDCAVFPNSSHETQRNICMSRFWSFTAGMSMFFFAVAVITVGGMIETVFKVLSYQRTSANIEDVLKETFDRGRNTDGSKTVSSSASYGYSSVTQPFFSPSQIKSRAPSENFFAGGISAPAAHH
tara:strand:+ start:1936 stop:4224 length:2289 start_codon:yes stop_codon:yes gene_type:complete